MVWVTYGMPKNCVVVLSARNQYDAYLHVQETQVTAGASTAYSSPSTTKKLAGWWARNAWWWWNGGGWTLSITPSGLAQSLGTAATNNVWNDALAIAGRRSLSSQAYSSMYEQLQCHLWYHFKTPFNLDSWRPVVSWWYELYRGCNP